MLHLLAAVGCAVVRHHATPPPPTCNQRSLDNTPSAGTIGYLIIIQRPQRAGRGGMGDEAEDVLPTFFQSSDQSLPVNR